VRRSRARHPYREGAARRLRRPEDEWRGDRAPPAGGGM